MLEQVVHGVPAPKGDVSAPLKALVFDSYYDPYKGVIVYIRLYDGKLAPGDRVRMMHTGAEFEVVETGTMSPLSLDRRDALTAGEVGYFTASIKSIADTEVGDTVTDALRPADAAAARLQKSACRWCFRVFIRRTARATAT